MKVFTGSAVQVTSEAIRLVDSTHPWVTQAHVVIVAANKAAAQSIAGRFAPAFGRTVTMMRTSDIHGRARLLVDSRAISLDEPCLVMWRDGCDVFKMLPGHELAPIGRFRTTPGHGYQPHFEPKADS